MKTEKTNNGWNETTTKKIIIKNFFPKPFSTAGEWVEFGKKRPALNKGGRNHCEYCGVKWKDCNPEMKKNIIVFR